MNTAKHMLSVVMDGIRDAEMLAGYAEDAQQSGAEPRVADWFTRHAKTRYAGLEHDWHEVKDELKLDERSDELADALICHVEHSIARVKARVEKL